jgi:hypothetical protein
MDTELSQNRPGPDSPEDARNREVVNKILQAIKNLRYGSVELTIHESKVVQIERKEKIRFDKDDLRR